MRADLRRLALVAALPALGACDWFTDFKDQPRIEPWEAEYLASDSLPFRGNPQYSVPLGGAGVPGFVVSYQPTPAALESLAVLINRVPPTPASIQNGRAYYQINCAVCHGPAGLGNGPVVAFGYPVPPLITPQANAYSDGYIYGIIRNGRGLMPNYIRIPEAARWDVVNYIRALQGRLGALPDTLPLGYPGETGGAVPGPSVVAPTRPFPGWPPRPELRPTPVAPQPGGAFTLPGAQPRQGPFVPPPGAQRESIVPTIPNPAAPGGRP